MQKQTVKAIVDWIEENVSENITVEDLVIFSGYSRRYIYELFKDYVGISPGQYIRQRRLSIAAIRLRLSSQSAISIAHDLYFDSQQSFSREFKKLFGVSPREYRKSVLWDFSNLRSSFNLELEKLPSLELVELNEEQFFGYEFKYNEYITGKPVNSNPLRLEAVIKNLNYSKQDVFLLSNFEPLKKDHNKLGVITFIGTKNKKGERG